MTIDFGGEATLRANMTKLPENTLKNKQIKKEVRLKACMCSCFFEARTKWNEFVYFEAELRNKITIGHTLFTILEFLR